ncbi:MAG: phosphatidate cytidylyltransferase [Bacteroidetes bacterium]|nr:phosphatidate cytidylyltransferase [Bacteroidota bacterium]
MSLSNLAQRVLVAVIAIPVVLFIVLYKPVGFYALAVMLSGITVWEYYGLARAKGFVPQTYLGIAITMCITAVFGQYRMKFYLTDSADLVWGALVAIILLSSFIVLAVEIFRNLPNPIVQSAVTIFGAAYIGVGMGAVFGVHDALSRWANIRGGYEEHMPGYFILAVFVSIWVCDSAAYFAGRAFGKHKFFERVSPKKTWEGAIAGFLASVGVWIALPHLIPALNWLRLTDAIIIGVIAGSIGQLGDLGKSLLKRDAGVKDSSNLIPGHGGFLDRLDSILFTFPVILILLNLEHFLQVLGV